MNLSKFRVIATEGFNFGVRQPDCAYRLYENCVAANHRWCRNEHSHKTAVNTARVFATMSGLNPRIGGAK